MMKVCMSQIRPHLGDVSANISKIEDRIREAIASSCDVVVFPELATSGYVLRDLVGRASLEMEDDAFSTILELSRSIDIVLGYAQRERGYFYNSSMYISGGEVLHNHKKVFLPDYGMFEEGRYFSPGESVEVFETGFGRTAMAICEDMFHLSTHYRLFRQGVDILFILSASPFWMSKGFIKPQMWKETARCFSRLSCSYTVFTNRVGFEDGVNFFGNSFVVDPFGSTMGEAPMFEECVFNCDIEPGDVALAREKFPVVKNEVFGVDR